MSLQLTLPPPPSHCLQVIAHAHVTDCGSEGNVAKRYLATVYGRANWSLSCTYQRHQQQRHQSQHESQQPAVAAGLYQRTRCSMERAWGTAIR